MNLFQRSDNHKTVKIGCMTSWFINTLLIEIASEKCVYLWILWQFEVLQRIISRTLKSSLENFVSSILKCCSSSQKCHFVKFIRTLKHMYTTNSSCNICSHKCGRKLIFDTLITLVLTIITAIFENIANKVSTSGLSFHSEQRLK